MSNEDFGALLRIISVFFIGSLACMAVVWCAVGLFRDIFRKR